MAMIIMMIKMTLLSILLLSCNLVFGSTSPVTSKSGKLITITDENWSQILDGEWMIEFYAPWCPACKSLQPVWEEFSTWSHDLGIQIGQIDVTNSPGLSGRFMITALPTIYHVTSGTFRQYRSPRTKEDLLSFIEDKKWEAVEPISSWSSPASWQMSLLSQFYKISMGLRSLMNSLTIDYGLPQWSTYLIFGGGTICIGLILGLILVCIIDCIYPPKAPGDRRVVVGNVGDDGSGDTSKLPVEEIEDEDDADNEAEAESTTEEKKLTSSDEEDGESKGEEEEEDKSTGGGGGPRKRRVRKAD